MASKDFIHPLATNPFRLRDRVLSGDGAINIRAPQNSVVIPAITPVGARVGILDNNLWYYFTIASAVAFKLVLGQEWVGVKITPDTKRNFPINSEVKFFPYVTAGPSIADVALRAGNASVIDLARHFIYVEGDSKKLSYSVVAGGAAAKVSVSTHLLTITGVTPGTQTVIVTATDSTGGKAERRINVTVSAPNRIPIASRAIGDFDLYVGSGRTVDFSMHFSDPDGDALVYAVRGVDPAVVTVNRHLDTGIFTGFGVGATTFTVEATDPEGLSTSQQVHIRVLPSRGPGVRQKFSPVVMATGGASRVIDLDQHFESPDGLTMEYLVQFEEGDPGKGYRKDVWSVAGRTGSSQFNLETAHPYPMGQTPQLQPPVDPALVRPGVNGVLRNPLRLDRAVRVFSFRAGFSDWLLRVGTFQNIAQSFSDANLRAANEIQMNIPDTPGNLAWYNGLQTDDTLTIYQGPNNFANYRAARYGLPFAPARYATGLELREFLGGVGSLDINAASTTIYYSTPSPPQLILGGETMGVKPATGVSTLETVRSSGGESWDATARKFSLDVNTVASTTGTGQRVIFGPQADVVYPSLTTDGVLTLTTGNTASATGVRTLYIQAQDSAGDFVSQFMLVSVGRPPQVAQALDDTSIIAGSDLIVDLTGIFTDPDNDNLTYIVETDAPSIVDAKLVGLGLHLHGLTVGSTNVTVRAFDPVGLSVDATFSVRVTASGTALAPARISHHLVVDTLPNMFESEGVNATFRVITAGTTPYTNEIWTTGILSPSTYQYQLGQNWITFDRQGAPDDARPNALVGEVFVLEGQRYTITAVWPPGTWLTSRQYGTFQTVGYRYRISPILQSNVAQRVQITWAQTPAAATTQGVSKLIFDLAEGQNYASIAEYLASARGKLSADPGIPITTNTELEVEDGRFFRIVNSTLKTYLSNELYHDVLLNEIAALSTPSS